MRITSEQQILGINAVALRDALRRVQGRPFSADRLTGSIDLTPIPASEFMERLLDHGLVEHLDDEPRYGLTVRGNALANARAGRPIKRATADRAVAELLSRVDDAEASDDFAYVVQSVTLFGSYLSTDDETVGDVDLAVELAPRAEGRRQQRLESAAIDRARQDGRQFRTIVDEIGWPQIEVMRHLKNRSRTLSFVDHRDKILEQVETKILYQRDTG